MVSNFTICFTGDLICQFLTKYYSQRFTLAALPESHLPKSAEEDVSHTDSKPADSYDFVRATRQGTVGVAVQTTILYFYLQKVVPHLKFSKELIPNRGVRKVADFCLRMGLHVNLVLPVRIASFFIAIGTLKYMSVEKGLDYFHESYPAGIRSAYCYWPFVMVGLYTVVPQRFGNIYYDSFNLVWMVILSYLANRSTNTIGQPS